MWKWRWNSFIKNIDIKWTLVTEVSWEVHMWERHDGILPGEQNLCFWQGPDNGLRSRRGRCSGSTSQAPSTPACACPTSAVLIHGIFKVFNFNYNLFSLEFFFKVLIISVSKILQIWFSCLMFEHLSVIRIMQDVIEGLWLHVTEHRLQADHSKKFHVQKALHGKPRAHFFKCIKMTQF